jgi:hypothetical protein
VGFDQERRGDDPVREALSVATSTKIPITPALTLSTMHITKETCIQLKGWVTDPQGPVMVHETGEYGWWVYVHDDGDPEVPSDLSAVLDYAQDLGCFWVRLDCDAPCDDNLPTF